MRRNRGFTLLEVVVALSILAMALMAIFDLNAGAVANHVYTKRLTVASLLARSKMTDLEQHLYDEGFSNDDDEESGDFSEEGWPQFKWRARIIAPKTEGVTPDQLIGAIFNLPIGGGGDDPMGGIAEMFGAGGGGGKDGPSAAGGPQAGASPMAGAAMGMAQPMFTQMVQEITQTVREVHLTVFWQEGTLVESIDLVTHVVSLGPGSDRNGGFRASAGSTPGAENQWVDENGQLIPNAVPGPNGNMVDPRTGRPVRKRSEVLDQLNNPSPGGVPQPSPGGGVGPGGVKPIFPPSVPGFGRPRSQGVGSGKEAR